MTDAIGIIKTIKALSKAPEDEATFRAHRRHYECLDGAAFARAMVTWSPEMSASIFKTMRMVYSAADDLSARLQWAKAGALLIRLADNPPKVKSTSKKGGVDLKRRAAGDV